jgi:hypothetical protein
MPGTARQAVAGGVLATEAPPPQAATPRQLAAAAAAMIRSRGRNTISFVALLGPDAYVGGERILVREMHRGVRFCFRLRG